MMIIHSGDSSHFLTAREKHEKTNFPCRVFRDKLLIFTSVTLFPYRMFQKNKFMLLVSRVRLADQVMLLHEESDSRLLLDPNGLYVLA